jgi:hypothetical protein
MESQAACSQRLQASHWMMSSPSEYGSEHAQHITSDAHGAHSARHKHTSTLQHHDRFIIMVSWFKLNNSDGE